MGRKKYTEEKEGAKERFDRAMQTIFQKPKEKTVGKKPPKPASDQPKRGGKD
jgi:hypothetical protein